MNKLLLAIGLCVVLTSVAATQDVGNPEHETIGKNLQVGSLHTSDEPSIGRTRPGQVPFCPPDSCLYYAGDYDSTWSGANGEFNADDTENGLEGQTWIGVRPDHDVTVTGAAFVLALTSGYPITNPTPFAVQVGVKPGQAGKIVCSTSGNATLMEYGYSQGQIPNYAYVVKKFSHSCELKRGILYYVNLLPTSGDGYGYVLNVPPDPANHYGWKNDLNHCYFNSAAFGDNYVPCDSQGNFAEFSIALTGK